MGPNLASGGAGEDQVGAGIDWISLDEGDADPVRFLTYPATALDQIEGIGAATGKTALGILLSPQPPAETILISLINDLAAYPGVQSGPAASPKSPAPEFEPVEPLSERELEVLELIAIGLTNPEIASRLFLSLNTVKVHTRNIYGKLGAHNRTEAVTKARAMGSCPPLDHRAA